MAEETSYRDAGVDIDVQDEALREVRKIVRETYNANVVSELGSFGGLFRADFTGMEKPILVSSADGIGTKLKVAQAMRIHDTVGADLVCHCVNDILVQGARPLFFLDYFATGKLEPKIMVDVVRGMANGCRENGVALVGGETAEMPGFYKSGDYDVAGFIVGVVDETKLIDGSRVREGDILIGLPSAGLHTNGYSLARKILIEKMGNDFQTILPEIGGKIGEVLLQPHLSYLRPLLPMVENRLIHAMAHITGGGLTDNIPRVLPAGLDAVIKVGSWEVPGLYRVMKREGNVAIDEMFRVFNMGVGMVLMIAPTDVAAVVGQLESSHQKYFFIGNVVKGSGVVRYDFPPDGFPSWIE